VRLTDAKVKAMRGTAKRRTVWEGGTGFGVRVEPTGTKSFVLWYRFHGKAEGVTLGRYPQMSLSTARAEAAKIREKISKGLDPKIKIQADKRANKEAYSVADLIDEYLEKWAKPNKKSWREDERILKKDVLPVWGRRKAKDLKRRDIVLLIDRIVDRGSPIQANRALATVRKMFNFALSRSILEISPCVGIQAPSKENRRDRMLSDNEIRQFWTKLDQCKMSEGIRLILKLLLVTAQRKGEIAFSEWTEFDLEAGWWTIPKEKSKNTLPHRVPLTGLALHLLNQAKNLSNDSRWVFPGRSGDKPITGEAIDHAVRNNLEILEIKIFTPHDCRRTAASGMTGMGIPRLVASQILNHAESGVTAVYDRHSYDNEKRQALEAWSRKLESILTGKKGKIVTLAKGGKHGQ
jgi:integrase